MGPLQSLYKSPITTERHLNFPRTNQFLLCVIVENPQTAHFVMRVTKPVNFVLVKLLANQNSLRADKRAKYAL